MSPWCYSQRTLEIWQWLRSLGIPCEIELTRTAITFSFKILIIFKGRQGLCFEDPVRPEGLARNVTSCFPISLACCTSPEQWLGTTAPLPHPAPVLKVVGAMRWAPARLLLHTWEICHAGKILSRRLPCIFCSCRVWWDVSIGIRTG